MAWTKRVLVEQAFEEIGLASFVYDIEPEQLQSAARKMDLMVGTWETKGIRIRYPFAADPDNIDLDTEVNAPSGALEALYLGLSLRIAPGFGKVPSAETKKAARSAYKNLLLLKPKPQEMQLPDTMPSGAGNKPWRDGRGPFLSTPNESPLRVGEGENLEFLE